MNINVNKVSPCYNALENKLFFKITATVEYYSDTNIKPEEETHKAFLSKTTELLYDLKYKDKPIPISLGEELTKSNRDGALLHNPIHGNTSIFSSFV